MPGVITELLRGVRHWYKHDETQAVDVPALRKTEYTGVPKVHMDSVIFLVMRRMRTPLLVLLAFYTIAVLGMHLMPGRNGEHMDLFHAFYFVSYMGTTIGFGEIPGDFSVAQRMWTTVCIYMTVVAWFYAIGALMALIQDEALRRTITERRFARTVRRIREPFYLVCGYGDTGRALVSALEERYMRAVVIENSPERINVLTMENYPVYIPRLCADVARPIHLLEGGLRTPHCAGVVALTDNNFANLQVAIISKLLNPDLNVICRVDSHEVAANMASFGTDKIINPFDIFAVQLHTALHSPSLHVLREWLSGQRHVNLSVPLRQPSPRGLWILCSYGRFGKAVYQKMASEPGLSLVTIESTPQVAGYPKGECVVGLGTEAKTLREARVEDAVGIVAGTDDDGNNLSIVMTAREINPDLFVILRQNRTFNQPIFEAAHADIVMHPSRITANHIRVLLTTPLLTEFIRQGKLRGEKWAYMVVQLLRRVIGDEPEPAVWETSVDEETMPAMMEAFGNGHEISFECLVRNPRDRREILPCVPLLLRRRRERILLPDATETIQPGDRILWCGTRRAARWIRWTFHDVCVFHYIITGKHMARSYVWQWWQKRREAWRQRRRR